MSVTAFEEYKMQEGDNADYVVVIRQDVSQVAAKNR